MCVPLCRRIPLFLRAGEVAQGDSKKDDPNFAEPRLPFPPSGPFALSRLSAIGVGGAPCTGVLALAVRLCLGAPAGVRISLVRARLDLPQEAR